MLPRLVTSLTNIRSRLVEINPQTSVLCRPPRANSRHDEHLFSAIIFKSISPSLIETKVLLSLFALISSQAEINRPQESAWNQFIFLVNYAPLDHITARGEETKCLPNINNSIDPPQQLSGSSDRRTVIVTGQRLFVIVIISVLLIFHFRTFGSPRESIIASSTK